MAYIALTGGAYQSRSIIASAQRCLNLYVENLPQTTGEPILAIHYCSPGLTLLSTAPSSPIRGLYRATNGNLYAVATQQLYYIDQNWNWNLIGTMFPSSPTDAANRTTPVSMCDNGNVLLLVDGSQDGWYVDLTQPLSLQTLARINTTINAGFLGADFVTYSDSFFICNSPGTNIFYISGSDIDASVFIAAYNVEAATVVNGGPGSNAGYSVNDTLTLNATGGAVITVYGVDSGGGITEQQVTSNGVLGAPPAGAVGVTGGTGTGATFDLVLGQGSGAFDPLNFAAKDAMTDNLVIALPVHRVLVLAGTSSYEVWQNSGGDGTTAGSFPFSIMYGAFGNFGTIAKYSVATITNQAFFLSIDAYGRGMIMLFEGLAAKRVSTHAIEAQIATYPTISDAIGYTLQMQGHVWYCITFPSGNNDRGATWWYDTSQSEWSERSWIDSNGTEYRHRVNFATEAYNTNVAADWENGTLYMFDMNNYTDNNNPILRLRSFPHQIATDGNQRVMYSQLVANMQVGSAPPVSTGNIPIVSATFNAPSGTSLQDYNNTNDLGAIFSEISGEMVIIDQATTAAATGSAVYAASGIPTAADYQVQFNVTPSSYEFAPLNGSEIYAIGRAVGGNGYQAGISSNGTSFTLFLTVMPSTTTTVALGTITSGVYTLTLTLQSSAIGLAVQRSQDGLWLAPDAAWGGSATAISIVDTTYTAAGEVLIGGNWN